MPRRIGQIEAAIDFDAVGQLDAEARTLGAVWWFISQTFLNRRLMQQSDAHRK